MSEYDDECIALASVVELRGTMASPETIQFKTNTSDRRFKIAGMNARMVEAKTKVRSVRRNANIHKSEDILIRLGCIAKAMQRERERQRERETDRERDSERV